MGRTEIFGTELGVVPMFVTSEPSRTEESTPGKMFMELRFQPTGDITGWVNIGKCDVGVGVSGVIGNHEYVGVIVIGSDIGEVVKVTNGDGNIGVVIVGMLNGFKYGNTGSDTFVNAREGTHEEVSLGVVIGIEGGCCCKKKVRR